MELKVKPTNIRVNMNNILAYYPFSRKCFIVIEFTCHMSGSDFFGFVSREVKRKVELLLEKCGGNELFSVVVKRCSFLAKTSTPY